MCWLVIAAALVLPGVGKTPLPVINCLRAEVYAAPLRRDPVLHRAAHSKALDVRRCGFAHDACGRRWTFYLPRRELLGEVLAFGYWTWRAALWAWTLSPLHLKVLLEPSFRRIGFSVLSTYYVVEVSS